MVSAIPEFCNIFPKTPPAPVINIIGAASLNDSPNQPVAEKIFSSNFLGNTSDNKTPMKSEFRVIHDRFKNDQQNGNYNGQ